MAQPALALEQQVLALSHVTLIDGTGASARRDMTVVVTGDRITTIGKSTRVRLPTNAVVVDATGKYLIPGIVNQQIHGAAVRVGAGVGRSARLSGTFDEG